VYIGIAPPDAGRYRRHDLFILAKAARSRAAGGTPDPTLAIDPETCMNPLLLALLLPIVEIWLFIKVGGYLGAGPTILWLLGAVAAGIMVIRHQGPAFLARLPQLAARGGSLAEPMLESMLAGVAGVLLIVPGFATDALALLLLLPPVRHMLARRWARRATTVGNGDRAAPSNAGPGVINGEATRVDD
jgi:UPF0716 protein FxsA